MKKKFKPEELIESVDAFPVPILKIVYPNHQSLRKTIVPIFLEMERWDIETSKPYTANSATTYGNSFEKYLKKSVNKNLPGYGDRTRPNYSSALRAPALEEEMWIGHEILLALPELKGLKEFILNVSRFANKFIGDDGDLMFSGSWMSINRQYGFHGAHSHMPCLWSGVYYVQALKDDAPITFIDANKKNKIKAKLLCACKEEMEVYFGKRKGVNSPLVEFMYEENFNNEFNVKICQNI